MLPRTGPGRPHTDLEARLERLFTRGRDLIRPEFDNLERRGEAAHPGDGSRLAQKARYHAARIGRARRVQNESIGLHAGRGGEHPLCSRRELAHVGHNGLPFTDHAFSCGPSQGFSRRPLNGVSWLRVLLADL